MTGENLEGKRNFGVEIRQILGNRSEGRRLLREMIIEAVGVDEDGARKVLDAFQDAELVIVTEEGFNQGQAAIESLQRLGGLANRLFPDSDGSPRT